VQFNKIKSKPRNNYREVMFLRSVLGLIEKWQSLEPNPSFDVAKERNDLYNLEKAGEGIIASYIN